MHRLLATMTLVEDPTFSRRFPAERWARVRVALNDGRTLVSAPAQAHGIPTNPMTDDELRGKYRELAEPVLRQARSTRIEEMIAALPTDPAALAILTNEVLRPAD